MFTALKQAWPFLALFGLGVAAVAATRPKGDAEAAYLADYFKQAPERSWAAVVVKLDGADDVIWNRADTRSSWPLIDRKPMPARRALRPTADTALAAWELPPAPAGMDAGSPLWRELVVETAVPTLSDDEVRDIAARWLREARDQARAEMAGAR